MNNYQIYEEIGKGRFSTVYKGRRKKSIEYYAISSIEKSQRSRVLNSAHFLRTLSHRNIIRFHNWYETNNHLWLITEYCTGGDLKTILQQAPKLPEFSTRVLAGDLVEGLMYIHSKGVVYADVKPSNILMDACATLRFYDFGLAHMMDGPNSNPGVGTPFYMAPELFLDGGVHSVSSDLWSLGCVMFEMAMGNPPFQDPQVKGLIQKITNEPHAKTDHYSAAYNELLDGLLQKSPLQRFTWKDVLASEFWGEAKMESHEIPRHVAFDDYCQIVARRANKSREGRRKNESLLRASVNAERNMQRELSGIMGYGENQEGAKNEIAADAEVDFRDPDKISPEEPEEQEGTTPPIPVSLMPDPMLFVGDGSFGVRVPTPEQTHIDVAAPKSLRAPRRDPTPQPQTEQPPSTSVDQVLDHPSDAAVKPIVMNSRIERIGDSKYDPNTLGFPARSASQLRQMPRRENEAFFASVARTLSGDSSFSDKCNVLSYIASLCSDTNMANFILNTSLIAACLKLLGDKNTPANVKVLLCNILGLTFRHAAVISPDLQKLSMFPVLTMCVANTEPNIKVRRRAAAGLGELLFYIATQPIPAQAHWKVSDVEATLFVTLSDADEILVHYVVKAIENILSVKDRTFAARFASKDFVASLLTIYHASSFKSEYLRGSALNAALRMCLVDPLLIPVVTATLSPNLYGEIVSGSMARTVQAQLSFINMILCKGVAALLQEVDDANHLVNNVSWSTDSGGGPFAATSLSLHFVKDTVAAMMDGNNKFVSGVVTALEHSNPANRGKACLCILMLAVVDSSTLQTFCENKLFSALEKLNRDKDAYVSQCCSLLLSLLYGLVNTLIVRIAHSDTTVPPSHLEIAAAAFAGTSFRATLLNEELIPFLAQGLALSQSFPPAVSKNLWLLLEAILNDAILVTKFHPRICSSVLPVLVKTVETTSGDERFLSLKIIFDLLSILMSDTNLYSPSAANEFTAAINDALIRLIALRDKLLDDAEPMPLFCLKVLSLGCEKGPATIAKQIAQPQLVDRLLSFLDLSNANCSACVANVLLRCLQNGGEGVTIHAVQHGLVKKLMEFLQQAEECEMGFSLDYSLEMAFATLCAAAKSTVVQTACVSWGAELIRFLKYSVSGESYAECSAACVHLLSQLYLDAQQRLLSAEGLGFISDGLKAVKESASVHIGVSLLRALLVCLQQCTSATALQETQRNEMFLLQLTGVTNASVSKELSELAGTCLNTLFERSEQLPRR